MFFEKREKVSRGPNGWRRVSRHLVDGDVLGEMPLGRGSVSIVTAPRGV